MKKDAISLVGVSLKDISPIAQAADPLHSNRIPVGEYKVRKGLFFAPETPRLKAWQAVVVENATDMFFVSPRQFLGLAFVNKQLKKVSARNIPEGKSLIDVLEAEPTITIDKYESVSVDVFNEDRNADAKQAAKDYPIITLK